MKEARTLVRWGLYKLAKSGPHLSGLQENGQERTSTPIIALDMEKGTALTAAGRPYKLAGEPDGEFAVMIATRVLSLYFDMSGSSVEALTPDEAQALLKGNTPFNDTPGERAETAARLGIMLDEKGEVIPPERAVAWVDLEVEEEKPFVPDPLYIQFGDILHEIPELEPPLREWFNEQRQKDRDNQN